MDLRDTAWRPATRCPDAGIRLWPGPVHRPGKRQRKRTVWGPGPGAQTFRTSPATSGRVCRANCRSC